MSAATSTSVTVKVPAGASYQPVSVTVNNLTAYSSKPFAVTFTSKPDFDNNSFTSPADSTTGLHPNGIAIADFDNDGKADIATPNNYSISGSPGSISVLQNTSILKKISFAPRFDLATGVLTYAIAVGDFNGDGKPDLVSSSISDKTISVFRNSSTAGSISFGPKIDYGTGDNPSAIAVADLNTDGKPDIVVVNAMSNSISVFRNTSSGNAISFATKQDFITDLFPNSIAVGDLDADGKSDIAVTNLYSNNFSIFRNTSASGAISFANRIDNATGIAPVGITVGDVDGDDKPDLTYVTISSNTVTVLKNTAAPGNISFDAGKSFSITGSTEGPHSVTMGDLNGDGKPDLVVPGPSSFISILKNNSTTGNISFSNDLYYNTVSPYQAGINDLDGDGKPDLAVVNFTHSSVSILRNKINEPLITSFSPASAKTGDLVVITGNNFTGTTSVKFGGVPAQSFTVINAETINAIVGTGVSGAISVTSPAGTGELNDFVFEGPPLLYSYLPAKATAGATVYVQGDNFVGTTAVLFGGVPAASFHVISPTLLRANLGAGSSGDVTVINPFGNAKLSGFTYTAVPKVISVNPVSGPVGTEVIITGVNFSVLSSENKVYFGAAEAKLISVSSTALKVQVPTGTTFEPVTVVTGPGRITMSTGISFVTTFAGAADTTATWTFAGKTEVKTAFTTGAFDPSNIFSIADLNQDGKPDLAVNGVKNFGHLVSVFQNETKPDSISLVNQVDVSTSARLTYDNAIADIDGDGKKDLILTDPGDIISIYRNTGTSDKLSFETGIDISFLNIPYTVACGDIDGDGKIDLVVLNALGVSVLRNTSSEGVMSFAPAVSLVDANNFTTGSKLYLADLDADGKLEIILPGDIAGSEVAIFKNTSNIAAISFAAKKSYTAGFYPERIAIGDIDADGKPDIVIAERGTSLVSVLKNLSTTSTLAFQAKLDIISYNNTSVGGVAMADFDGDGLPDLATTSCCDYAGISIFKNTTKNGIISFGSRVDYNYLAREISLADMDNDGKPDLIFAANDSITILRNQVGESVILGFSPAAAATGDQVIITGVNLNGSTAVSFGGVSASSFTVNSPTSITATVGAGASGNVSVTKPGRVLSLAGFTFIAPPTITSFTPVSGGTAATVTITGTNLTGATAVSFGGITATSFTVVSATSITAVVGTGASGNLSVTTPGGTATKAGFTFTVVTAIDPVNAGSLGIRLFPNPTHSSFIIDTLKLADKWESLEIFDTQGKQMLANFGLRNKTMVSVNIEFLPNGLYMAILKRKKGQPTVN